eukprot:TRINITY_DN90129_c0_g1_i1.p1 TRINITY_DN90129_c0_g1~~TRINITY_DN90129_c0_g1_i1.p1  ORF type:complete len:603 (-),score=129.90 TRINITY_DN90129_c0_g1_i1:104-1912(-)
MYEVGDLVDGRVVSEGSHGLLLRLTNQSRLALLPSQVKPAGSCIGDEFTGLLVVVVTHGGQASIVVPEAAAEDLVASASVASPEGEKSVRSRGRWGASAEAESGIPGFTEEQQASVPLLVGTSKAAASSSRDDVPSRLSQVDACGTFVTVIKKRQASFAPGPAESEGPKYVLQELLHIRRRLDPQCRHEEQANSLVMMPCRQEELDEMLLQMLSRGQRVPPWWGRCSHEAKRKAMLLALRTGRLGSATVMQAAANLSDKETLCFEIDHDFLQEAMQILSADAAAVSTQEAKAAIKKKVVWRPDDEHSLDTLVASAWAPSEEKSKRPAAAVIGWLLERGASVEPLLPESPGPEALAVRLCCLQVLSELGPAAAEASSAMPAAVAGCLRDPEVRGRRAAAMALASFGPAVGVNAPRAVPRLLRLMQQEQDPQTREAAACALGRSGSDALATISGAGGLEHDDDEVRGLAALAIGESGAQGKDHVPRLLDWLRPDAGSQELQGSCVRVRAAQALGRLGVVAGVASVAVLAECLKDDVDQLVREAAAVSLGQIGRADRGEVLAVRSALLTATKDAEPFVKEAALLAIEKLPQQNTEDFDTPQQMWQ